MKINKLIRLLEVYQNDSEQGSETEVTIMIHSQEWNTSGFYINKYIDDVCISYGQGPDDVQIEIVLKKSDLDELNELRKIMVKNNLLEQ